MYTADFETNNHEEDCRVWAWSVCEINTLKKQYGDDIESFIDFILGNGSQKYYFHNLKFDGNFIISYLLNNGWKHTTERTVRQKEFKTLISDKGQFYSITMGWSDKKGKKFNIIILDSYKLIPFKVEKIAEDFDLPIKKGKIDYNLYRPKGYKMTEDEKEYLKNDVEIMARALQMFFEQGLDGMTIGSNALKFYKNQITTKSFNRRFPVPVYDADIRQSYKGAWTYLNPKYANIAILQPGLVFDVNSLYPWVMSEKPLPFGEGKFFTGKYKDDKDYPLYVQMISCEFELKSGYLPTIQLKNNLSFIPTQYISSSEGEEITMCLTCVDLAIFLEHYEVYNLTYHSGWKFKSSQKLFKDYVDYWVKIKIQSEKDGNMAMRVIAKLYLNNLYGKFAKNPIIGNKYPVLDENGIVRYKLGEKEEVSPIYIPVAAFITAYAREKTISSAQKLYDRFIYADTDSLHIIGTEIPDFLDIDKYRLGAWKHESTFEKARFIRAKSYIEVINGENKITCAGLTKDNISEISFDDFKLGFEFNKSLKAKSVPGGVILKETPFKVRA